MIIQSSNRKTLLKKRQNERKRAKKTEENPEHPLHGFNFRVGKIPNAGTQNSLVSRLRSDKKGDSSAL